MDAQRFQRIVQLFENVCDLSEEERALVLERECADDQELRARVEQMIRGDRGTDDGNRFDELRGGLGDVAADVVSSSDPDSIPQRIGDYRILEVLGSGGMGVVYRAEQDHPRRPVALKVIRAGVLGRSLLRRFELEAELLGRLQHPGIAQIFEASTAGSGDEAQPFLAMELVEGQPLTDFVVERQCDTHDILRLLIQVAHAVHHAHQKGVIHRDLKPSNVLVTDAGKPKVLDFGVARTADTDDVTTTLRTHAGQIVGTLAYMSPEQVLAEPDGIDTRTDVYSLGVMAYELLARRLPHALGDTPLTQAARIIAEEEPRRLGGVDRTLRGDIEIVVAKAMEKDRGRRYPSASELAADLERIVSDEPIEARPPSTIYQLAKFARRNTGLVAGLAVALVILIVGMVGVTVFAWKASVAEQAASELARKERRARLQEADARRQAEESRAQAQRHERIARASNEFVDRMLSAADPWLTGVPGALDVTVLDVVDQAAEDLEEDLVSSYGDLPEVEAAVRSTLGRTYVGIGHARRAEPHLVTAYEIRLEELGAEHPDTLISMQGVAELWAHLGYGPRSEELARRSLAIHRRVYGDDAPETIEAIGTLLGALYARGRVDEGLLLAREAWESSRDILGVEDVRTVRARNNLAVLQMNAGHYEEAEVSARDAIDLALVVFGEEHPETQNLRHSLGLVLYQQGRAAEAEALLRDVHETYRQIVTDEHPATLNSLNGLIGFLHQSRRFREADRLREEQLERATRVLGPDNPLTLSFMSDHAVQLTSRGLPQAEEWCVRVLEARRRVLGNDHWKTVISMDALGNVYLNQWDFEAAERMFREAIEVARETVPEGHWLGGHLRANLGSCLGHLEEYDEAEKVLLEGLELSEAAVGLAHPRTHYVLNKLIGLYEKWGRPDDQARYQRLLDGSGRPAVDAGR